MKSENTKATSKKIFLICPVRNASKQQQEKMSAYIENLEADGAIVYYPARDTDQNDSIGYRICQDNSTALSNADEIHIWFDPNSQGSLFDLGMAFALKKPMVIANKAELKQTPTKSFTNMIIKWSEQSKGMM